EAEPEVARGLTALLVQQLAVALEQEQPGHRGLARRTRDESAPELGELLARPHLERVGVPHELTRPARRAAVQLVQQVLLAVEVTIDRSLGHAGFLGDLPRGRMLLALRGGQLPRGAHEALPSEIGLGPRSRI